MYTHIYTRKGLFEKGFGYLSRLALQKTMLLTVILLTNVLIVSFSQKASVLLSTYDSCHVQPPPQQPTVALRVAGGNPMLRVAYVIPSNRTPQPDGVANLQYAVKTGQQFFKQQMEQNGFGPKTFVFETEADGVTPLIHVVPVSETDEYLRGDLWGRTQQAASNAGISLWAAGGNDRLFAYFRRSRVDADAINPCGGAGRSTPSPPGDGGDRWLRTLTTGPSSSHLMQSPFQEPPC